MTVKELEKYTAYVKQKEWIMQDIVYISGIDYSKPPIQSSNISDSTYTNALKISKAEEESEKLEKKITAIEEYIENIDDEWVKAIAVYHILHNKTYDQTGREVGYSGNHARLKLYKYVEG